MRVTIFCESQLNKSYCQNNATRTTPASNRGQAQPSKSRRLPVAAVTRRGARGVRGARRVSSACGVRGMSGRGGKQGEQRGPVRRPEAAAGIPARAGLVGAVVALDDVVEAGRRDARGDVGVDQRLEQAESGAGG